MTNGLESVVVAETRLSEVNGERGELLIAGSPVGELAERASFEEVCSQLWERPALGLGEARVAAFALLPSLGRAMTLTDRMASLRAALAQLEATDDPLADAVTLTGAMAVFAAARARLAAGLEPVAPDPARPHAEDYLRMITGEAPSREAARGMESYLITVVDHGLNASTFAARVVASTESDLVSAITAAIGALKGRLHGGAPGPVLDMLDAVQAEGDATRWLTRELDAGHRIMGMGHRVYRVRDPRAAVLEGRVRALRQDGEASERLRLAKEVEEAAERLLHERKPDRALRANVEFYTAVLLEALGVPRESFTPTFACGRVVGWCAHVFEQRATGRLIRPRSTYVGPRPSSPTSMAAHG